VKFLIALGQPVHGFEGTLFFAPDNQQAAPQLEYAAVESQRLVQVDLNDYLLSQNAKRG
jgi:hypothetical protein